MPTNPTNPTNPSSTQGGQFDPKKGQQGDNKKVQQNRDDDASRDPNRKQSDNY